MITHCISTYNNLPYLKLAVQSVRTHSYWKDAPFIIHAENCTDGTNEWLRAMADQYDLTYYVDKNDNPKGIGGGMNFCAEKVSTEYINFLHSDFYVTKNWDLELMKVHDKYEDEKLWVNSFRIEPNMFGDNDRPGTHFVPKEAFGAYYDDFNPKLMLDYAKQIQKKMILKYLKEKVSPVLFESLGGILLVAMTLYLLLLLGMTMICSSGC